LLAHHTTVKLLLMKCSITSSDKPGFWENIEELKQRGFKIGTKSSEDYAESIAKAFGKSNVLVTKINMKRGEIERNYDAREKTKASFPDVIASLEVALGDGRNIPDDITLAKYNALKKLAKAKALAIKNSSKRGRHARD